MAQPGLIFISYAREDRDFAEALAEALSRAGFAVWWDFQLLAGHQFREEISSKIDAAKTVIVIWSAKSIVSGFVLDEASRAARQNKLVPLSIGGTEPPLGFGHLHTLSISSIKQDIGRILGALEETRPRHAKSSSGTGRWIPRGAAAIAISVACVGVVYSVIDQRQIDSMINCFKYGCALNYVTYRSKPMRMQIVYPMRQLMLDTTKENLQHLPMLNAKGEIEVEIFRSPLPTNYDPIRGSAEEQANLKEQGWTINYVAPQFSPEQRNWYVISGLMPNGWNYYFRRWYTNVDVVSIEFRYPPEVKVLYDKIIEDMTLRGIHFND
jgi:TIR domain